MPFSKLVTELRADLTGLRKDLKQAEAELRRYHQLAAQLGTVRLRGGVPPGGGFAAGGRLPTLGGVAAQARTGGVSPEVREKLADFAQVRRLQRDLSDFEDRASRERRAANKREADQQERRRARELQEFKRDIQERAREETRVRRAVFREQSRLAEQQGLATGVGARGRAQVAARGRRLAQEQIRLGLASPLGEAGRQLNRQREEQEAARRAAANLRVRRGEEQEADRVARALGLGTRAQEAREARIRERDRMFSLRHQSLLASAAGQAIRIDRPGGGFFGGGGPPGGPPRDIDEVAGKIRGGLTNALQRASNAAQQLNLLVGVSIFGGLGALVAEGFRLNSELERVNLTMAATLATTNDVVTAQGKLVEGPERANFLLRGTAGIYEQVRKIAAETILEQQELIETVAENLSLGQQAGFRLERLGEEETGPLVQTIANISQLAKAIGLPGGQRQLSQEVRALFTGERLQGATIARLLGFTSVRQIQELQQKEGKQPGTTAFVDELNTRFERAQPILDKFKDSAQGVFSTLISQGRLFLTIFSEAAFKEVLGGARNLRDFLTDARIRATAEEVGKSFGNFAKFLIDIGRSLAPLVNFFGLLVRNASTIIGVLGAFKALSAIQNFRGIGGIGGAGGLTTFLGGGGAANALGVAGGLAAGGAGRAVGPIRGAAIQFASAQREFGLRGALGQRGLDVRGAFGSTLGGGGLAALAPAAGLFGLTPAVLLAASLGGGVGLGTLVRTQAEQAGQRAGFRAAPAQANAERARSVARIPAFLARRNALEARARDLERRGAVARQGDFQPGLLERFAFGGFFSPLQATPALTERVTARGLRGAVDRNTQQLDAERKKVAELGQLSLKRQADEERDDERKKQRLEALLSLADVRRQREAAINIQAELDARAARKEIADQTALSNKLKAIRLKRNQDIRELRENEASAAREALAAALKDEVAVANLRAQREKREATRRINDTRILADTLRAIELNRQREVLGARINRFSQRAGFAGQLAGAEGRVFDQIRASAFSDIAGVAQQRIENRISGQEFDRFVTARQVQAQEEIRRKRREVVDEGISLAVRFTETVRQSTDLQREYELSLARLKERVRDRDFARVKQRLQEEVNLRRATQTKIDAIVDKGLFDRTRGAQRAAFQALQAPGAATTTEVGGTTFTAQAPSVAEQVRRQIARQVGQDETTRGLPREQQGALAEQQTTEFLRGLVDTLLGQGGLQGAIGQLQELGVRPTAAIREQLAGAALEGGRVREDRTVFGEIREARGVNEAVEDARQRVEDTRDDRAQSAREDRRVLRDELLEREQIQREFSTGLVRLTQDFSNISAGAREFLREVQRAGIALSDGLTAVLQKATGVRVPSPEALAAQDARAAVAADQAAAGRTIVQPPTAPSSGRATGARGTAVDGRRSDAGNTYYINLGGVHTNPRIEQLMKQIAAELELESRRTTTG